MSFVYPTIARPLAQKFFEDLVTIGGPALRQRFEGNGFRPKGVLSPSVNVAVASERKIKSLRQGIDGILDEIKAIDGTARRHYAFDTRIGMFLADELEVIPAQSGSVDMWSYLGVVVFPDVHSHRFNLSEERVLGGPRNTLRRLWYRERVLGDLLRVEERPLGEDELVALTERSRLSRNAALVQGLAKRILALKDVGQRSYFVRDLMKNISKESGTVLIDSLDEEQLEELIDRAEARTRTQLQL